MSEPTTYYRCPECNGNGHHSHLEAEVPYCQTCYDMVPVVPDDFQRVRQGGGMGSWRCNTCGTDCRANSEGCEGSDYDFTPSYWPDDSGDYILVPLPGAGNGDTTFEHEEWCRIYKTEGGCDCAGNGDKT